MLILFWLAKKGLGHSIVSVMFVWYGCICARSQDIDPSPFTLRRVLGSDTHAFGGINLNFVMLFHFNLLHSETACLDADSEREHVIWGQWGVSVTQAAAGWIVNHSSRAYRAKRKPQHNGVMGVHQGRDSVGPRRIVPWTLDWTALPTVGDVPPACDTHSTEERCVRAKVLGWVVEERLSEGTVTWYSCGVVKWNKCNEYGTKLGLQVVCIQSCVELSIELCGTRSWGFQSIRELYIEPRKLGGWEAIPLPTMPYNSL